LFDIFTICIGKTINTVLPMLTRHAQQSLTEQLAERFAERIRARLLAPGARLPSVRECARQQGVSAYTVVAAYDQLLAQGLVEARRQRGFFVREWNSIEMHQSIHHIRATSQNAQREKA
jgi:DNA-binding transcriptional regulator YhcF (GntR family)